MAPENATATLRKALAVGADAAWLDMPHLSELTGLTLDGTTLTGTCEDADVRAELGLDVEDFSVARTIMTSVAQRPPKEAGQKLTDDGSAGRAIAEYLFTHKLAVQPS